MGIFDPSRGANPDQPIDLVNNYQRRMNQATYSPAVAQAAARSGTSSGMATRIAAREVAQQSSQVLPGLLTQEAQMMEARRLENERKEREKEAMIMNIAGQVGGTLLSAYGGGGASAAMGALQQPGTGATTPSVAGGAMSMQAAPQQPQPNFIADQVQPQRVQMVQAPMVAAPMPAAVDQAINAPMQNGAPMPTNNQIASELYDEAIRVNQPRSQAGARRRQRTR